jgi:hypothetical protein
MVVEIIPWSGRLCPFKNHPPPSYGPYSSASIVVNTVSPDSVDDSASNLDLSLGISHCANTRHLVFWANCHKSVVHFLRIWQFAVVHSRGSIEAKS